MKTPSRLKFAALLTMAIAGCGGSSDGLPREPLSGKVVFDGQPLEGGLITFTPIGKPDAPIASGIIADGAYAVDRADGPIPGPHKVEVWARRPTGKKVKNPDEPGQFTEEIREIVPRRYNLATELKADVEPSGSNNFDFDLSSLKVALKTNK
jgi:hypothetical protein